MHDARVIREDPAAFDAAMARRGLATVAAEILALDDDRRASLSAEQDAQTRRNTLSKEIGPARRRGDDTTGLEAEATALRDASFQHGARVEAAISVMQRRLAELPNVLDATVPDGTDEADNVEQFRSGEPPEYGFNPRQHFELGETLGMMQFEAAAKLAGSRFTVLRGSLARLERALGQFMIDLHVDQHGYEEASVPALVNDATMFGTGQLPKFAEDSFKTIDGRWLIPTAEVPLTNLAAGEIIPEANLPRRLVALTECFRREAGSAGRDTRGMLRQHQFRKVELVSIVLPEDGDAEHERMTCAAETVLAALGLTFRRMLLCSGDTGFSAAKTYDLEVWLPGQQAWREISSCSNIRAFQARRMNARYRAAEGRAVGFVHTLNGSGVAVGRALIAVMETHQTAAGAIAIPPALRPYMGGTEIIKA